MRNYQVGLEYYFRELGCKVPAGSVISLRQGDAQRYMTSHPGLLREMPMTTQARPQAVRSAPVKVPVEAEPSAETEVVPDEQPVKVTEVPKDVEAPAAEEVKADEPAPAEAKPEEALAAEAPVEEKAESKPKSKARAKK